MQRRRLRFSTSERCYFTRCCVTANSSADQSERECHTLVVRRVLTVVQRAQSADSDTQGQDVVRLLTQRLLVEVLRDKMEIEARQRARLQVGGVGGGGAGRAESGRGGRNQGGVGGVRGWEESGRGGRSRGGEGGVRGRRGGRSQGVGGVRAGREESGRGGRRQGGVGGVGLGRRSQGGVGGVRSRRGGRS